MATILTTSNTTEEINTDLPINNVVEPLQENTEHIVVKKMKKPVICDNIGEK